MRQVQAGDRRMEIPKEIIATASASAASSTV
jgi:hypothetical protein